jgi:hypothetical protein
MLSGFRMRAQRPGALIHNVMERTFLATSALLIALITLLLLFFGVYFKLV